jgi:transposase
MLDSRWWALTNVPSRCAAQVDRGGRWAQAAWPARTTSTCRRGTANIYGIVEPKAGRHLTHATCDRKAPRFVGALQRLARRYRRAKTIHLIMDNLNLHRRGTVIGVLGAKPGAALWARFTPHYTPKHGSWLNPAEIEASLWSRECHGRDRVETLEALRDRTRAWTARAD